MSNILATAIEVGVSIIAITIIGYQIPYLNIKYRTIKIVPDYNFFVQILRHLQKVSHLWLTFYFSKKLIFSHISNALLTPTLVTHR